MYVTASACDHPAFEEYSHLLVDVDPPVPEPWFGFLLGFGEDASML